MEMKPGLQGVLVCEGLGRDGFTQVRIVSVMG